MDPPRTDERGSRRELIVDVVLAITLGALVTFVTFLASHEQAVRRAFDVGTVVLIWVAAGALVARRRHPVVVLEVVFGATLVYFMVGYANGPIWLALIVAYVTAVLRGHRLAAGITAVAGFAIFPWLDYLIRDAEPPSALALAGLAAWLLVLLGGPRSSAIGGSMPPRRSGSERRRPSAARARNGSASRGNSTTPSVTTCR